MLIKQALATYDSDKTGMVDYALETAGQFDSSERLQSDLFAVGIRTNINT